MSRTSGIWASSMVSASLNCRNYFVHPPFSPQHKSSFLLLANHALCVLLIFRIPLYLFCKLMSFQYLPCLSFWDPKSETNFYLTFIDCISCWKLSPPWRVYNSIFHVFILSNFSFPENINMGATFYPVPSPIQRDLRARGSFKVGRLIDSPQAPN